MSQFVEVYEADSVPQAYVIKAALEGAGITVQITNEYLEAAFGGLPLDTATPRVLVPQSQVDLAMEVLRDMQSGRQGDAEGQWEDDTIPPDGGDK